MKKTLPLIDLLKFIASLMIFTMHCNPFEKYMPAQVGVQILARWGVPFFFVSSAFFLCRKGRYSAVGGGTYNISRETLLSFVRRIALLYFIWFIYNLPNVFVSRLYGKNLLSVSTWSRFMTEAVFSSTFTGSWFLVSCIFSAWMIFLLSKRFQTLTIVILTLPFYLICSIPAKAYPFLSPAMADGLNFLCFPMNIFAGLFYFSIGKFISEKETGLLKKIDAKKAAVFVLLFYSVYAVGYFLLHGLGRYSSSPVLYGRTYIVSLFLAPTAVSLFLLCLASKTTIQNHIRLRKMSTIIYCAQGNLIVVIKRILQKKLGFESMALIYIVLLVLMAAIVTCVLLLQRKSKWKWTGYLT